MPVKAIASFEEFRKLVNSNKPVFIDFWADWSAPSRTTSTHFEKISDSVRGAEFYKVDVDDQPEIAGEVGVRTMPTFIAYQKGTKLGEFVKTDAEALQRFVENNIKT